MIIFIPPQGNARALYHDDVTLSKLGRVKLLRASHVEPDEPNRWWADLSPVSGPRLGPFEKRGEALAAEVAWLEEHVLNRDDSANTGAADDG